jgi:two-component sensor histidine kinase
MEWSRIEQFSEYPVEGAGAKPMPSPSAYSRMRRIASILPTLLIFLLNIPVFSQVTQPNSRRHNGQIEPRLLSIRSALHRAPDERSSPVLLRGTITYIGTNIIIQDQTGAIAVHPLTFFHLTLGDEAEVLGDDKVVDNVHAVEHAKVKRLWRSSSPVSLALSPDLAAEGEYNLYLVEIEGSVVNEESNPDGSIKLSLEGGHQFFSANLQPQPSGTLSRNQLDPGNVVQLTGVLSVHETHYGIQSGSFTLLLRSSEDIRVVKTPPWWTAKHIGWLALTLIPVAALIHFLRLRGVQKHFASIMAERGRIARDIHDTLAQGFAGIAFQLEGAAQEIERDKTLAQEHLNMALSMVRHSRAEAHRSISTLRASTQDLPLEKMIEELVSQMSLGSKVKIHINLVGGTGLLPSTLIDQLFRVTQEAVSNTLQHAKARNIWIALEYRKTEVVLQITDDGCGFNVEQVAGPQSGHFGLVGMRERAERLNGTLSLTSSCAGTKLDIHAPRAGCRG